MVPTAKLKKISEIITIVEFVGKLPVTLSLVGGVAMAVYSGVRDFPGPTIVFFAVVSAAAVLVIAVAIKGLFVGRSGRVIPPPPASEPPKPALASEPLKQIRGRVFQGGTVLLDGHEFIGCHFISTGLQYEGGHYGLTACKFEGHPLLISMNDAAIGAIKLYDFVLSQTKGAPISEGFPILRAPPKPQ